MYSSQFGIEEYVEKRYPLPGFFLEIGCWDGENLSQTAWLERERGWRGACVDPFPKHFENRNCDVYEGAISAQGGKRKFWKVSIDRRNAGDVSYFSGFADKITANLSVIQNFCEYEEVEISTVTMTQLFYLLDLPPFIEFLSLDTEGSEAEILDSIDYSLMTFGLIAVEHNKDAKTQRRIGNILIANQYQLWESFEYDDLYICSYKQWLAHEYRLWIEALQESTVHDFKDHPMVRRMLGEVSKSLYLPSYKHNHLLHVIDNIGRSKPESVSGVCLRMAHYARKVLDQRPNRIMEIGGGVGEFYAILRALGYEGDYYIYDLPEVKKFQAKYLQEVSRITGLETFQNAIFSSPNTFCVSFYALGEFDDETKAWYIENVVKPCGHGLIVWNPHSGASETIPFECNVADEVPTTNPQNKVLTW